MSYDPAVNGASIQFSDLPLVESEEVARHVHRTPGLFLVKRGGVAHGTPYGCLHIDPAVVAKTEPFARGGAPT